MGVFAYYDPDTESPVYHVIPSPESEYAPSSFSSESDSSMSGTTIRSDDLPGYFVLHQGRQHSSSKNALKFFPSDNVRRYVLRCLVNMSQFGGNYVGPVREMLAPVEGQQRRALELGTKTGTWIQAMAVEFPHVQFHTLDMAPMIPHVPRHNIVFEVYDYTYELALDDGSQDVVFLNFVLLEEVKDHQALLREVYRVLRPGGLIYINDYNPNLWDTEDLTVPARRTNPLGCRFFAIARQHMSKLGLDPDTCDILPQWLLPGSSLWDGGQQGFRDIRSDMRTIPYFPHEGYPCMKMIDANLAPYVRQLTLASIRDSGGLAKDCGLGEEEAERLINGILEEVVRPEGCAMWKVYCIYGIKI